MPFCGVSAECRRGGGPGRSSPGHPGRISATSGRAALRTPPRPPARRRTLTEDEMAGYVAGMEAVIVGDDPVTHRVLDRATALKVISKFGTHVDNIDVDVAAARHIPVTFTPGVTHAAVAELTIGLMF